MRELKAHIREHLTDAIITAVDVMVTASMRFGLHLQVLIGWCVDVSGET